MAILLLKRGNEADITKNASILKNGELTFAIDTKKLFVGWDGEAFEVAQIVEATDGKLYADLPAKPFYLPLASRMSQPVDTCRFCGALGSFPDVCANTRDMEDFAIQEKGSVRGERCYDALVKLGGGEKGLKYVELNRNPPASVEGEDTTKQATAGRLPQNRQDPPIEKWWEKNQPKGNVNGTESKAAETSEGTEEGKGIQDKSSGGSADNKRKRKEGK